MDIKCPKCGEPWEIDTLHEFIEEYFPSKPWLDADGKYNQKEYERIFNKVYGDFRLVGCNAINQKHNPNTTANPALWALAEMLGDDVDGYAAMVEDFGL